MIGAGAIVGGGITAGVLIATSPVAVPVVVGSSATIIGSFSSTLGTISTAFGSSATIYGGI